MPLIKCNWNNQNSAPNRWLGPGFCSPTLPFPVAHANRRLAKHLIRNRDYLVTYLPHPDLNATNYRAVQALCPAVVNRKV